MFFTGGSIRLRPGESLEHGYRRFKKIVDRLGLIKRAKQRRFHVSAIEKRREKSRIAHRSMRSRR